MKYNAAYLESPIFIDIVRPIPPPPPSPSPDSPAAIDLERGDPPVGLFQRPRLVQMVYQHTQTMVNKRTQTDNDNTDSDENEDDDQDKDSDLSSIAISMTEEVIASSSPSTTLFKSGISSSVVDVSTDESGKSKSMSKGEKSSTSKSTAPLVPKSIVMSPTQLIPEVIDASSWIAVDVDVVPMEVESPNALLLNDKGKDNDKAKNDFLKADARAATYSAAGQLTAKKKPFQALNLSETENSSSSNRVERPPELNIHDAFKDLFRDDVPLPPPPRSAPHQAAVLSPNSEPVVPSAMPLPRIAVDFRGLETSNDDRGLDHDDFSLVYKNDEEDQDLHLSTVYKQHAGWEDEEGVVLSTNPAWLKLLDGDSITATLTYEYGESPKNQNPPTPPDSPKLPDSANSSSSMRMSGKSYDGEEGRFRRKQSFMTVDSDVVAVKAGGTYFLLHKHLHTLNVHLISLIFSQLPLAHPL